MTPATPLSERFDGISWAFFFVWIGISLLGDFGLSWTLAGVAAIVLATQAALFLNTGKVHRLWVACGAALLLVSFWLLLGLNWPLSPILLIVLGAAIFAKTVIEAYRRP